MGKHDDFIEISYCIFKIHKVEPSIKYSISGNSVIAVNGDENVDLENTRLYKKASRPSLT